MPNFPIITVSIINYNNKESIFQAIESAVNQDYPALEIIITDNNSTDGTREMIESKISKWEEKRKIIARKYSGQTSTAKVIYIKNKGNAGFGKPHNQAIRMSCGDFILLLNSDAILSDGYIENALKPFDDPRVSSVQGKLLRYDFDKNKLVKGGENDDLNIIDTVGLLIYKNRRIICIGQGQADKGQFENEKEIFGVDGAAPIYRKKALEDVKMPIISRKSIKPKVHKAENFESAKLDIKNSQTVSYSPDYDYEYFDENFFMYKEDVDLAWRLRLYGWKAIYTPKAVAYHGRGSGDSMAENYLDIIKERRKINKAAKYLSFKHQRLMQIKNDSPRLLLKHFPQFITKEIGAWVYMMIFERFTFKVLMDFYRDVPLFLRKRKIVTANKKVEDKDMERWFR